MENRETSRCWKPAFLKDSRSAPKPFKLCVPLRPDESPYFVDKPPQPIAVMLSTDNSSINGFCELQTLTLR
ncbi:hypothetical protein RMSM_04927 [Rhodopirellula maiorica SM1]|uniref:Uncharacterized protein n=1 Tax=Rhodopirellula maiorica SM1 TaxID=1265738 RepID=M5RF87_9BACT|nr:hypothetical protein RMSM_04927 [Rhodopirellula maiorica SM1]